MGLMPITRVGDRGFPLSLKNGTSGVMELT